MVTVNEKQLALDFTRDVQEPELEIEETTQPVTRIRGEYFSSRRDREVIAEGGFFCETCLVGKPISEASPDPCCCQICHDFLLKEAQTLSGNKSPKWTPSAGDGKIDDNTKPRIKL